MTFFCLCFAVCSDYIVYFNDVLLSASYISAPGLSCKQDCLVNSCYCIKYNVFPHKIHTKNINRIMFLSYLIHQSVCFHKADMGDSENTVW